MSIEASVDERVSMVVTNIEASVDEWKKQIEGMNNSAFFLKMVTPQFA